MSTISQMIKAIRAASDKRWIPEELRGNSYFSSDVIWIFIPSWDARQCEECGEIALGVPFIAGSHLRREFPYMEIVDENTINANVHPNCRCTLVREGTEEPKEVVEQEEAKEAFITGKD